MAESAGACQRCSGTSCEPDDAQEPAQEGGNCRREVCHDGRPIGETDDTDVPPDRDPHDCLKLECSAGRPQWATALNEELEQIPGNCFHEKCPAPAREPDASDAPSGLVCCIDLDPVFDDVAPYDPENQCCTPTGVRAKHPISIPDLLIGACPEIRRKESFNWPIDPPYDGCSVPPEVQPALEQISFYSGDKDNPAGFDDTSFAFGPHAPCEVHDACYFDCRQNQALGHRDCNLEFVENLLATCLAAEPSHRPACAFFADLYATGVLSFGPIYYPQSQQAACQCC